MINISFEPDLLGTGGALNGVIGSLSRAFGAGLKGSVHELGVTVPENVFLMPDGRVKILVQGLSKGEVDSYLRERPYFEVKIRKVIEPTLSEVPIEVEALIDRTDPASIRRLGSRSAKRSPTSPDPVGGNLS